MPTPLESKFAAWAAPALMGGLAVASSSYQAPKGGTTTSGIDVAIERNEGDAATIDQAGSVMLANSAALYVRASQLPAPVKEGVFTVDAATWVVIKPPTLQGGIWRCVCERDSRFSMGVPRQTR